MPLIVDSDLTLTLPRTAQRNAKITVSYTAPFAAPIAAGKVLGKLTIAGAGFTTVEVPLKAGKAVDRLGFMGRLSSAVSYLLWGSQHSAAKK